VGAVRRREAVRAWQGTRPLWPRGVSRGQVDSDLGTSRSGGRVLSPNLSQTRKTVAPATKFGATRPRSGFGHGYSLSIATAARTVAQTCREAKDASHLLARASRDEKDACLR